MSISKKNKNFIWNAIGLSLNAFNSLFFLIIVKLVNGVDIAGIFTYAFSLCCLFYVLAYYYNRTFQVSDANNSFSFNDYLSSRILLSVISLICIVCFSLISQFASYKIYVITILMGFRVVESISDCFYGEIQKKDDLYKTGISLSLKAILGVLLFLFIDLITQDLLIAISSLIIINVAILLVYDIRNYHKLNSSNFIFTIKNFWIIIKVCFPVFAFTALSIYLANCQKLILTYYVANDLQTIFGILIMPATMLSLVGSYFLYPLVNRLTTFHSERSYDKFINLTIKIIFCIVLCGIIVLIISYFIGIPVLNWLYRIDLESYLVSFMLLLLASLFYSLSMIFSNLLTILDENIKQSWVYFAVSITTSIISVILIQEQGLQGAVFAFLISSILLIAGYIFLFCYTIIKRKRENNA